MTIFSLVCAQGCIHHAGRFGPPLPLPSGEPASVCEASVWIDVVPAISGSSGAQADGYALYPRIARPDNLPLRIDETLPSLDETAVDQHVAPVANASEMEMISTRVMLGGVGLSLLGAGLVVGGMSEGSEGVSNAGFLMAAFGLVATLGGYGFRPSARQRELATLRERLFFPTEEGMAAVRRGIADHNLSARARCNGQPVAATAATAPITTGASGAPATRGAPAPTAWCALRRCNSTVAPDAHEPGPGVPAALTAAPTPTAEPAPAR